jgi:3D-(3,5/4)-trihydroxycyclohexane-1,2-dione acylhydrolase (decyclizing)
VPGSRSAEGAALPIDFAAYAAALGAVTFRARTIAELDQAIAAARAAETSCLIEVKVDRESMSPAYDSWWRVGVAEVSASETVREAGRNMREQTERVWKS